MAPPPPSTPPPLLPLARVRGYLTLVKSQLDSLLQRLDDSSEEEPRHSPRQESSPSSSSSSHEQQRQHEAVSQHGGGGLGPQGHHDQTQLQLQAWALQLELIQRGNDKVLSRTNPPPTTSSSSSHLLALNEQEELVATLQFVRDASGKGLLLPDNNNASSSSGGGDAVVNLLSNVSILQGRVAEAMVTACSVPHPVEDGATSSSSSFETGNVTTLLSQVQERCRQVQDDRFLSLLNLLSVTLRSAAASATTQHTAPHAPRSSFGPGEDDATSLSWSYVAEGCYGRAAVLAKNNPPSYKAAWDAVAQRRRTNSRRLMGDWEALEWITNLRRIAASRNNAKKVTELSLCILEMCLPTPSLDYVSSDDFTSATSLNIASAGTSLPSLVSAAMKAFVSPVRSVDPPEAKFVLNLCEEQLSYLKGQPPPEEGGELRACTYRLLWTLQKHEHEIELDGRARHVAAMNRRASAGDTVPSKAPVPRSSSATSASLLQECLRQARVDSFQRLADDDEYIRTFVKAGGAVDALIDVIQRTAPTQGSVPPGEGNDPDADSDDYGIARRVVVSFLSSWHKDYLQARMLKLQQQPNGTEALSRALLEWTQRAVSRLVEVWQRAVDISPPLSISPPMWIVTLSTLVAKLEWMLQNFLWTRDGHFFSIDVLRAAQRVLESVSNDTMPTRSLSAGDLSDRTRRTTLDLANRTLRAILYLSQQGGDDNEVSRNLPALVSEQVAGLAQGLQHKDADDAASWSGRYGTPFYEFVVAWSGLGSTVPWPYAVTPEARIAVNRARTSCECSEKQLGRPVSDVEDCILKIAMADAEGGLRTAGFAGDSTSGMAGIATTLYEQVLGELEISASVAAFGHSLGLLLKSKCCSGLVSIALRSSLGADHVLATMPEEEMRTAEGLSRSNLRLLLQTLGTLESDSGVSRRFLGSSPDAVDQALRLQIAYVRNQVSECLMQKGLTDEAGVLLQEAVAASPEDPAAAFALGSFRLRVMFFHVADPSTPEVAKTAQIQLLKAAKLDASSSSPFALLGYWYEYMRDEKRALGCYSKALLLDPWHPVAGRGILRLQPRESLIHLLQKATESGSPFSGWAWKALGIHKTMVEGRDDLAVISLLQTLRCPDVASPSRADLSVFFASPSRAMEASNFELVDVLAELAECYRRLGRYTASLRTYNKALDSSVRESATPPPRLLVSCARVEMELGLFDEASDKFSQAMVVCEDQADSWQAAHGLGICLLSMAKRDHEHGKAGLALQHLQRGIDACRRVGRSFGCVQKILGDLYSLGAVLPPGVFSESDLDPEERTETDEESMVRRQVAFVDSGVRAYEAAESALQSSANEESLAMCSSVAADIGSNLLLQAQLMSVWNGKGVDEMASPETEQLLDRAEKEFRRSVELNPTSAAAWCGLGCAVHKFDPLLAQHAFCRSIELDPMFPEPYANLSFLYTRCGNLEASEQMSMALTQVADTPMMWMNRALLLERQDGPDEHPRTAVASHPFEQSADAYRAALQVTPLPSAKYGLALTCRRRQHATAAMSRMLMDESHCLLTEYKAATGNLDAASRVFGGVATLESGAMEASPLSSNLLEEGRRQVAKALERLDDSPSGDDERDGDLDKAIIRIVLGHQPLLKSSDSTVSSAKADAALGNGAKVSDLKRRLLLEPNRGDLWLALAKALVLADPAAEENEEEGASASGGARAAADKACYILNSQAQDPTSRPDKHQGASARGLSEALALRCWLQAASGAPSDESEALSLTLDLQRALMLCPDNDMAREALVLVCGL